MTTQSTLPVTALAFTEQFFDPDCWEHEQGVQGRFLSVAEIAGFAEAFARHSTPDRNAVLAGCTCRSGESICARCQMVDELEAITPQLPEYGFDTFVTIPEALRDRILTALTTTPEPTDPAGVSELAETGVHISEQSLESEERLRAAYVVQQTDAPDQFALVKRRDLGNVLHELIRHRAGHQLGFEARQALRTPDPVLEVLKEALERLLLHFNDDGLHKMRVDLPLGHQAMAVTAGRAALQAIKEGSK